MEGKGDSFFLANMKKEKKPPKEQNGEFKKKREENFNKNRPGLEKDEEKNEKKPFDKKTYRLKKYSKKYKLDQWEEQRKKKLLREYYKDVKNDPGSGSYSAKTFDDDTTDSGEVGRFVRHPDFVVENPGKTHKNKDPFKQAKEQYTKIQQEKLSKKQEKEKLIEEKQRMLQEYKKKKQERFKKLSKKTKRGQPVMTGRLELLLEKLQKSK